MVFYYKTFKVPTWVVVDNIEKKDKVIQFMLEKFNAVKKDWAVDFKSTLMSFKNKGWKHELKDSGSYVLNPQLLSLAVVDHVKEKINKLGKIEIVTPFHRLNRNINSDKDYENLFTKIIEMQDALNLSQIFSVGELCHNEDKTKNITMFVSESNFPINIINQISDNVVTIGDGDGFTINTKDQKNLKKVIDDFFSAN